METPQLNALPSECSQSCHDFVLALNDDLKRAAENPMFADISNETEVAGVLQAVTVERFHGPEIRAVIAEQTSAIAISKVGKLENPVSDINAMDVESSCAVNGCKLVRAALLLSLPKHT